MRLYRAAIPAVLLVLAIVPELAAQSANSAPPIPTATVFGYRDFSREQQAEQKFLAVPDAKLAEEHLRTLTAAPHLAGTPEVRKTAEYVAQKFREAGLKTQIVEYKVWMNYPAEISMDVVAPPAAQHHGPQREQVSADPFQADPRVVMRYNSGSPSGDVEAEVVYANYGRPEDFKKLDEVKTDVHGKIVLVPHGEYYRRVQGFVEQARDA